MLIAFHSFLSLNPHRIFMGSVPQRKHVERDGGALVESQIELRNWEMETSSK